MIEFTIHLFKDSNKSEVHAYTIKGNYSFNSKFCFSQSKSKLFRVVTNTSS
jgi:hypothetical protein